MVDEYPHKDPNLHFVRHVKVTSHKNISISDFNIVSKNLKITVLEILMKQLLSNKGNPV